MARAFAARRLRSAIDDFNASGVVQMNKDRSIQIVGPARSPIPVINFPVPRYGLFGVMMEMCRFLKNSDPISQGFIDPVLAVMGLDECGMIDNDRRIVFQVWNAPG